MGESWWNKRMAGVPQLRGYGDDVDNIYTKIDRQPGYKKLFDLSPNNDPNYVDVPVNYIPQRKPEQANQRMTNEEIAAKAKTYGFKFDEGGDVPMMGETRKPSKVTQKDRYGNTVTMEYAQEMKPFDPTALAIAAMEQNEEGGGMSMEIPEMNGAPPHPGGPKGTDTVPAWLTPGEFVMNAEASRMFGPQIEAMNEKGKAQQKQQGGSIPGGPQMLAGGGPVNPFQPGTYAFEQFEKGRPSNTPEYTPEPIDPTISPDAGSTSRGSGGYNAIDGLVDLLTSGALGFQTGGAVPFLAGERLNMPQYQADGGWITDELLDKLAEVESGGNNDAVSPVGAIGKYQWMPKSAAKAGYGVESFDPKDEKKARAATAKYLKNMQKHHGFTQEETLRAYNWGPGNVIKHKKGIRKDIPDEAANYPIKILGPKTVEDAPVPKMRPSMPQQDMPQPPPSRPQQMAELTGGDIDELDGDMWASGGEGPAAIKSNWMDRVKGQVDQTEATKNLPSNVVPELTDVPPGHAMFNNKKEPYRFDDIDDGKSWWQGDKGLEDSGGDADGNPEPAPSKEWQRMYDKDNDEYQSGISENKLKITEGQLAKDKAKLDKLDPTSDEYDATLNAIQRNEEELENDKASIASDKAAAAATKKRISIEDEANLQGKIGVLAVKEKEAIENGDEKKAALIKEQKEKLEKKVKLTPNKDKGETTESKKVDIAKEIKDKTGEAAKEVKQNPDEIVAKGETASNKEKSEAFGFLKDLGLDSLFDKKELARMAIMYAGSRLLGNSHDGSLGWAANNYINRVDTKEANIQALIKGGKYSTKSIQAYKESGDASDLLPVGVKPQMSGEFKSFWTPNGKKVRAQKVTVGKSKYWIGSNGEKINSQYNDDPSTVKNTPEYNAKVKADSKHYTGMIKGLRETFGTTEVSDGKDLYSTDLVPAVSGNNIAKWAASKNVPATEMGNIVTNAYHDAIAHSKNTGEKVRNIDAFLNNQYVISQVGDATLFQDETGKTADSVKVASLFSRVQNVANEKGKRLTNIEAVKVYRAAWSKLPQEDKEKWNSQADVKQTGYNGFMKFIQSDLNDGVMNAK